MSFLCYVCGMVCSVHVHDREREEEAEEKRDNLRSSTHFVGTVSEFEMQ